MPAPNAVPRHVDEGLIGIAVISVANAARDGTGTIVTVATGALQGTLVELIRAIAQGVTTAGNIKLFIRSTGVGTWRIYEELSVIALTPSATQVPFEVEYRPTTPLVLPSGYELGAAPHNAETFNVFAIGGNY